MDVPQSIIMSDQDQILQALRCADADLQGMLERHDICDASYEDIAAAKTTRVELRSAIALMSDMTARTPIMDRIQSILLVADSDARDSSVTAIDELRSLYNLLVDEVCS